MSVKIIATIGPSSLNKAKLQKMKSSGMNIGRINTKYSDENQWNLTVKYLRELNVDILIDIKSDKYFDWIEKVNPEYIAISFAETVSQIRKVQARFPKTKIIVKIETEKGFRNFKNLLKYSYGIMVARGDLGKSVSLERVPTIQRDILSYCNFYNKFGIVATEMLLSMVKNKVPTSAEVNDVFMAAVMRTKAVMLSEETAIGQYPTLAVFWMRKIVDESSRKN